MQFRRFSHPALSHDQWAGLLFSRISYCLVREIREPSRWIFSKIESAVADQLSGGLVLPKVATNCSIMAIRTFMLEKLPLRIARCVMISNRCYT